jgi:hypothetical protein
VGFDGKRKISRSIMPPGTDHLATLVDSGMTAPGERRFAFRGFCLMRGVFPIQAHGFFIDSYPRKPYPT